MCMMCVVIDKSLINDDTIIMNDTLSFKILLNY